MAKYIHSIFTPCNTTAFIVGHWLGAEVQTYNLNDDSTMYIITIEREYDADRLRFILEEHEASYEDIVTTKVE